MNSNDWYLLFFVNQWGKLRLTETTGCKRGVCNKIVPKLPRGSLLLLLLLLITIIIFIVTIITTLHNTTFLIHFSIGRLSAATLHSGRPVSSRQLRHAIFSSTIPSMVAICDVNLSAPRNSGLSVDYLPANMVILGPGKLYWLVTHGNSASYRWCGRTFGRANAAQALLVFLFKRLTTRVIPVNRLRSEGSDCGLKGRDPGQGGHLSTFSSPHLRLEGLFTGKNVDKLVSCIQ